MTPEKLSYNVDKSLRGVVTYLVNQPARLVNYQEHDRNTERIIISAETKRLVGLPYIRVFLRIDHSNNILPGSVAMVGQEATMIHHGVIDNQEQPTTRQELRQFKRQLRRAKLKIFWNN